MINILILGVGGNVSQGILRALAVSDIEYRAIGACVDADALGLYFCDTAYVSPYANDPLFIPWLVDVCNKEKINIILTGVEEVIETLAYNKELISKNTKSVFISSDYEKLQISKDKSKTCEWLRDNNCHYPAFANSGDMDAIAKLASDYGYPLIAKPRIGKGSQGVIRIENEEALRQISLMPNYVIQECIGTDKTEYTVGCYCDKEGVLVEMIIMHRELKHGMTLKATVVESKIIREEVEKICRQFRPIGPINIQLRLNEKGIPICFELNVRFSGTTPMRAQFGYQDVVAVINEYVLLKNMANCFNVRKGTVYRYWNEFYIDEKAQAQLQVKNDGVFIDKDKNYADGCRARRL